MKALLVAAEEKAVTNISEVLKSAGYNTIVYKWLLKALDNIEEIAPHLIVISTTDYPRHWKILAQHASIGFGDYRPQIILYTDENFTDDEEKKAAALHVRGKFDSVDVNGLDKFREILSKTDDIFSGYLTEEEQAEISVDDLVPNAGKFVGARVEEAEIPQATENEAENSEPADEMDGDIDESFDELSAKVESTSEESDEASIDEQSLEQIESSKNEAEDDERAADYLSRIADDEKAADKLEEISGDELAADKLERIIGNDEIPTVSEIIKEPYDDEEGSSLPGVDELERLLNESDFENKEDDKHDDKNPQNHSDDVFEESESDDIIEETGDFSEESDADSQEPSPQEIDDPENGENAMADEQNIDDKLAEIMSANRADRKEKAEALKLDTGTSSVSFVFTNPVTLAMVSGTARNYNGLVLEFTPDIPVFIMNLSPGTKINVASMKIGDKIENVFAEVISNDVKKLALAIKK